MKILAVEDDEGIRDALSQALQSEGYSIILATNGKEALEWLDNQQHSSSEPPHLILSDLHMPMMNGLELFAALKSRAKSSIPFIFMTSQSELTQGIAPSIRKPFELDLLLKLIRTTLGNH